MLIISKNRDYYDTAIGYGGIDKSIVYNRKEIEIIDPDRYSIEYTKFFKFFKDNFTDINTFPYRYRISSFSFDIYFNVLLFCGEIYMITELYYIAGGRYTKYFYNFNEIKNTIVYKFKKELEKNRWDKNGNNIFKRIKNFYDKSGNINQLDLLNYHRGVNSPVILFDMFKKKVILNPILSRYDFYKIYDPFQTYQKLEMFLSGVMGAREKEIIEIDDKSMRDKKGFDNMSFKKEKEM